MNRAARITAALMALAAPAQGTADGAAAADVAPRLSQTGLYADGRVGQVHPEAIAFAPQYPLWTDGATKRRWIQVPAGRAIDARDPDRWRFPVGTRFWKEFSFGGRPVETRTLERTRAGWRFATYVWNADGTDAELAPERGGSVAVTGAGGRHTIPSRGDCLACHDGADSPVLGFSALQLSPDRDPRAPHAEPASTDLRALVERGVVRNLPPALLARPPRIQARDATERAALGYLHANCGGCHNGRGPLASLGLRVDQPATGAPQDVLPSLLAHSQFRPADSAAVARVAPGKPDLSTLVYRMRSASPLSRMPPLGTAVVDQAGVRLIEEWIANLKNEENGR